MDCMEQESHARGYLIPMNSKGEARRISRHQNNSKGVVKNLKERRVGTKGGKVLNKS